MAGLIGREVARQIPAAQLATDVVHSDLESPSDQVVAIAAHRLRSAQLQGEYALPHLVGRVTTWAEEGRLAPFFRDRCKRRGISVVSTKQAR